MNHYGDAGNIVVLVKRAKWRNIEVTVENITVGDKKSFANADLIYLGGGQGREQLLILPDLMKRKNELFSCIANHVPILAICGGFQLFGQYYQTSMKKTVQCLGLLDYWTIASPKRMVGKIAIRGKINGVEKTIIGFENHTGRTFLGKVQPLGKVLKGHGNNGKDNTEGVLFNNFIGTYLHGLLPYHPCWRIIS